MIQTISPPRIRRRIWNGGESWQLDFSIKIDGKKNQRIRKSFHTRGACEDYYRKVASEVAANQFGQLRPKDDATLQQLVDEFHAAGSSGKRKSSIVSDRLVTKHLLAFIPGHTKVRDISGRDIDRFVQYRTDLGRQPATIAKEITTIRRLFNLGVRWEYLTTNPASEARKPRIPQGAVVALEYPQQLKLIEAAAKLDARPTDKQQAPYLKPLVTLLLHTGMRKGEILNLRWGSMDFTKREISVENAMGWKTKTGRNRIIGMSNDVVRELNAWKKWFDNESERIRQAIESASPSRRVSLRQRLKTVTSCKPAPDRLVFPSFREPGQPMDNLKKSWATLTRTAGVNCGIHDLRHTFAVSLARAGVPLTQIGAALGHSTLRTTEIYLRFMPDEARHVVAKLPCLST